jgi:hypothetical protein
METVTMRVDTLKRIINNLQNAVQVCYGVDPFENNGVEKTYSYATGYSRAAMQSAIEDFNNFLNK